MKVAGLLCWSARTSVKSLLMGFCLVGQGRVFVDRDPKHFGLILNFLRDGHCVLPTDSQGLQEVLQEADFYQVFLMYPVCPGACLQCFRGVGSGRARDHQNPSAHIHVQMTAMSCSGH